MIRKILITIATILLLAIGVLLGFVINEKCLHNDVKVYVASHQLSQRTRIGMEDIKEIELPKDYISEDIYCNAEDILGKYVKLSYSIPSGSFIYKTSLESNIKDLANTLLNENEASYDIYVGDVKMNTGNLNKNMYIDLYLTINNKDKPVSDLLISNARIIGLYDSNDKLIYDYDNDSRISIVSVAVNKQAINILNKAQVVGELSCVVNNNAYSTYLQSTINTNSLLFDYLQ